jgi:hypothetical protein
VSPRVEARSQTARSGRWCHGTRVIEYDPGTVSFFFLPPSFISLCPPLSLGAFSRTCVRICGCCGGWVVVAWGPVIHRVQHLYRLMYYIKIHPPYKPCTIGQPPTPTFISQHIIAKLAYKLVSKTRYLACISISTCWAEKWWGKMCRSIWS